MGAEAQTTARYRLLELRALDPQDLAARRPLGADVTATGDVWTYPATPVTVAD